MLGLRCTYPNLQYTGQVQCTHIARKWIRPVDPVTLTLAGMTRLRFQGNLGVRSMQGSFSDRFALVEERPRILTCKSMSLLP